MTWSLAAACLWVLAATVTALLPMHRQYPPGLTLLVLAPVILIWIGVEHGFWAAFAGTAGFASMFRNPLIYLVRKVLGKTARHPENESGPQ